MAKALRFIIPSDYAQGRLVQKQILDELERCQYVPDAAFAIRLALEEALINAIKHGNKLNPEKRVRIRASVTPRRTEIVIEDEGAGFDRGGVPDPRCEHNLQRAHGRGILLMESYMDKITWSKDGRCVRMVRGNHPAGHAH